jgi:hypothetical protein
LANKPFKPRESPWEYLFVPSYLPKNATIPVGVIVKRVHHSIGDGFSLVKCLISYACGDSLDKLALPTKKNVPRRPTNKLREYKKIIEMARSVLMMPYDLTKHMFTIDTNAWFLPRSELSRHCHLGLTKKIPVSLVKEISGQRGVSFSAILFSAVGGGIGKFMERHSDIEIPNEIQCFTPFPRGGHPNNKLVNHLYV